MLLLRLQKLAAALRTPINRRGLRYLVAPSIEHSRALGSRKFNTIIDIGANKGQFALFARDTFPKAKILSFEPIQSPADIYEAIFSRDSNCKLYRTAVGQKSDFLYINVTEENDASSFLAPTDLQSSTFGTRVSHQEKVRIGPLNSFLSVDDINVPALLKLDVQGFELEALKGCAGVLDKISSIYLEVSFVELYAAQPLASQIISWLGDKSFELAGVFNQQFSRQGEPVQADMLFERSSSPMVLEGHS